MYPENWRFTPVIGKIPIGNEWQNKPKTIQQITTAGVGLMLGAPSKGVCAIDFDGFFGIEWFERNITSYDIFNGVRTVIWSSGKPGRCQMAFMVPEQHWHDISTIKVAEQTIDGKKSKHLEFRWTGAQSVLPPSPHPESDYAYNWLCSPEHYPVDLIPDVILKWWLHKCKRLGVVSTPSVTLHPDDKADIVSQALYIIQRYKPKLDYADWFKISSAVYCELGKERAKAIMQTLWPEQTHGEYDNTAFKSINPTKSAKGGSLTWMARQFEPDFLKKEEPMRRFLNTLARRNKCQIS